MSSPPSSASLPASLTPYRSNPPSDNNNDKCSTLGSSYRYSTRTNSDQQEPQPPVKKQSVSRTQSAGPLLGELEKRQQEQRAITTTKIIENNNYFTEIEAATPVTVAATLATTPATTPATTLATTPATTLPTTLPTPATTVPVSIQISSTASDTTDTFTRKTSTATTNEKVALSVTPSTTPSTTPVKLNNDVTAAPSPLARKHSTQSSLHNKDQQPGGVQPVTLSVTPSIAVKKQKNPKPVPNVTLEKSPMVTTKKDGSISKGHVRKELAFTQQAAIVVTPTSNKKPSPMVTVQKTPKSNNMNGNSSTLDRKHANSSGNHSNPKRIYNEEAAAIDSKNSRKYSAEQKKEQKDYNAYRKKTLSLDRSKKMPSNITCEVTSSPIRPPSVPNKDSQLRHLDESERERILPINSINKPTSVPANIHSTDFANGIRVLPPLPNNASNALTTDTSTTRNGDLSQSWPEKKFKYETKKEPVRNKYCVV